MNELFPKYNYAIHLEWKNERNNGSGNRPFPIYRVFRIANNIREDFNTRNSKKKKLKRLALKWLHVHIF